MNLLPLALLLLQTFPSPGPKNNTGGGGGGGISLINHTYAGSTNNTTVTTPGINTTGANFLVAVCGTYAGGGSQTVSDSLSNSWTARTNYASIADLILFYVANATVGAGQTFSCNGGGTVYPAIAVFAFSNVATSTPFDVENGFGHNASTVQPGSITPTINNELVISGFVSDGTQGSITVNSGFTNPDTFLGSGNSVCISIGYLVQTSAGAVNPLWTGTNIEDVVATIASFK